MEHTHKLEVCGKAMHAQMAYDGKPKAARRREGKKENFFPYGRRFRVLPSRLKMVENLFISGLYLHFRFVTLLQMLAGSSSRGDSMTTCFGNSETDAVFPCFFLKLFLFFLLSVMKY